MMNKLKILMLCALSHIACDAGYLEELELPQKGDKTSLECSEACEPELACALAHEISDESQASGEYEDCNVGCAYEHLECLKKINSCDLHDECQDRANECYDQNC